MSNITIDDVLTDANLFEAWSKVRRNKGSAGSDGETIELFEQRLMQKLDILRKEVRLGTYRPRPLLRVMIEKEGSSKFRALSIPAVRDRVLQTAVALVLTPVFEAEFEEISFAYRKGRSVEQAVALIVRLREQGYRWVVDADIRAFFDSIDHERLMQEVEKLVKDPDILKLVRLWIKSKVRDGKCLFRLKKGVPQGSPISPLLSNLYLDHLDDELLDEDLRLVRFADDFVILCKSKKKAEDALEMTEDVLEALKLELNERKTQIVNFERGFRFLGVQFIRSLTFKTKRRVKRFEFPPSGESRDLPQDMEGEEGGESSITPMALALARAMHEAQQTDEEELRYNVEKRPSTLSSVGSGEKDIDTIRKGKVLYGISSLAEGKCNEAREGDEPVEQVAASHDPRLRTLYLLRHDCALGKSYERLVVYVNDRVVQEIPVIKIDQIIVFGNASITTPAMKFCLSEKIPIVLLSGGGKYHGIIDSFDTDPVLLHREQFRRADEVAFCLDVAREMIRGKLANSRTLLLRYARRRCTSEMKMAADRIKSHLLRLDAVTTLDELRGHEGSSAKIYFSALGMLLGPKWNFTGRFKRPPTDPVNALLSYGYTLLFYNIYALIRAKGLNPHVGYLHPMRSGHPALVSDLIEEFRALIVDAVVLNLLLNKRLTQKDFTFPDAPEEPCLLSGTARKRFIREMEKKFNSPITHPGTGYKMDYRRCMEVQIQKLAAVIRGREDKYEAMILR